MYTYLALLRGINVGGNTLIRMDALRVALTDASLANVRTYIQSGNVLFESDSTDTAALASHIKATINSTFALNVDVVVHSAKSWQNIVATAPAWWGKDPTWKHNLLVLIPPYDLSAITAALGTIKPDIEHVHIANGVVYQSICLERFGQASSGRLAGTVAYKQMTIRNYNTSTKLAKLLEAVS